jgi:hypothetical protein
MDQRRTTVIVMLASAAHCPSFSFPPVLLRSAQNTSADQPAPTSRAQQLETAPDDDNNGDPGDGNDAGDGSNIDDGSGDDDDDQDSSGLFGPGGNSEIAPAPYFPGNSDGPGIEQVPNGPGDTWLFGNSGIAPTPNNELGAGGQIDSDDPFNTQDDPLGDFGGADDPSGSEFDILGGAGPLAGILGLGGLGGSYNNAGPNAWAKRGEEVGAAAGAALSAGSPTGSTPGVGGSPGRIAPNNPSSATGLNASIDPRLLNDPTGYYHKLLGRGGQGLGAGVAGPIGDDLDQAADLVRDWANPLNYLKAAQARFAGYGDSIGCGLGRLANAAQNARDDADRSLANKAQAYQDLSQASGVGGPNAVTAQGTQARIAGQIARDASDLGNTVGAIANVAGGAAGIASETAGVIGAGKMALSAADDIGCLLLNTGCFAAGTHLLTPDGSKPIEEFQPFDLVLSREQGDPDGPLVPKVVVSTIRSYLPLIALTVGDRVIHTTAEHPFWVVGKGWVDAHQIEKGDLLLGAGGETTPVCAIEGPLPPATVYNLEIEDYHSYLVTGPHLGVLVLGK